MPLLQSTCHQLSVLSTAIMSTGLLKLVCKRQVSHLYCLQDCNTGNKDGASFLLHMALLLQTLQYTLCITHYIGYKVHVYSRALCVHGTTSKLSQTCSHAMQPDWSSSLRQLQACTSRDTMTRPRPVTKAQEVEDEHRLRLAECSCHCGHYCLSVFSLRQRAIQPLPEELLLTCRLWRLQAFGRLRREESVWVLVATSRANEHVSLGVPVSVHDFGIEEVL